jgi:hypothetical protein
MTEWHSESARELLARERRVLRVLERQAASYTSLTLPAELAVRLEDQRSLVSRIEQQLLSFEHGSGTLEEEGNSSPDCNWRRSPQELQRILSELQLYCPPNFVEAFFEQVISATAYRQDMSWRVSLSPTHSPARPVQAVIQQSYIQVPGEYAATSDCQFVVFHIPAWLSADGKLIHVAIETLRTTAMLSLREEQLRPYREHSAYGVFYRVPFHLRRGQTAKVDATAVVFHPKKSEDILLSYLPSFGFQVEVALASEDAKRFRVRSEWYHPSRSPLGLPTEVLDDGSVHRMIYRIQGAVLPFQGIRVSWDFRRSKASP